MKPKTWKRNSDGQYTHEDYPDVFIEKCGYEPYWSTVMRHAFVVCYYKGTTISIFESPTFRRDFGSNAIVDFETLKQAKLYIENYYHTLPRKTT